MPHGMSFERRILHLPLDDQMAGLVEDAALRLLHHQRRHQIFEHRARPRHQRAAEADLDDRPAEPEPVIGRYVALGDGEQAGEPRFRGQQIVAGLVELPFLDAVADRQQVAVAPQQEGEIHLEGDQPRPLAQRLQPGADRVDAALVEMRIADMRLGGRLERDRPARQVLAQLSLRLLVDGGGELADLAGEHDQVERADRRRLGLVADRIDRAADAGDAFAQPLAQRPQLPAIVGQRGEALLEDRRRRRAARGNRLRGRRPAPSPTRCRRPRRPAGGRRDCRCRRSTRRAAGAACSVLVSYQL